MNDNFIDYFTSKVLDTAAKFQAIVDEPRVPEPVECGLESSDVFGEELLSCIERLPSTKVCIFYALIISVYVCVRVQMRVHVSP